MDASQFHEVFGNDADYWGEHTQHSLEDWQYEVENGDTRLGYWGWVAAKIEEHGENLDDKYREKAKELYEKEGEIEIDSSAKVSHGDDPGAYVQAWVWVPADQVVEDEEE